MTIETKFNIGDTVWYLYDNKVLQGVIVHIELQIDGNDSYEEKCHIKAEHHQRQYMYYAEKLFPSKEELLKSL
ncbi:MAG: hypothetical protein ACRCXN_03635 [Bacteroidales bacterium]